MENNKEATEKPDVTNENIEPAQQEVKLPQQQEASETTNYEKQRQELLRIIEGDDEDDEDYDDDEERDTSQKLIIDIPDDDEEEEEDNDEEEVMPLEDLKPQAVLPEKEVEKPSPKPENVVAIITLSDGEEDVVAPSAPSKPGKVQKRRSVGSASAGNEEEHYRLKRRKINVAGAPKMPLTGYVRYMNDRRESLRKEYPSKTAIEHTRIIGEEWQAMAADLKAPYLKAADVDKKRYVTELNSFLKSRPDILASELAKNKIRKPAEHNSTNPSNTTTKSVPKEKQQTHENPKSSKDIKEAKEKQVKEIIPTPSTSQQATDKSANERTKRKRTPTPPPPQATTNTNASTSTSTTATTFVTPAPGEIPIFTNEFLEHNKLYDMELRSLRKSKTDLEQQNSVLEKHVENMKFGVEKMITENNELQEKNHLLEIYLDKLKRKLAQALGTLPLPTAPNGATVNNIDKYMQDLYKMSTSNSHGPATLNKAKDIIRKLDLQIQL